VTTDEIYGDRRCPTCRAIKLNTTDDCWNCTPRHPNENEVAAAMAETIRKEIDTNALEELLVATGLSGPFDSAHDPLKMKVVADPTMKPGTFELRTLSGFRQLETRSIRNLAGTVRAMQSRHLHEDARRLANLANQLADLLDLLKASAEAHGQAANAYERGGNADGAMRLRAVQNLLWGIIDGNGQTILPWEPDAPAK
jgi:hypothetical protein